MFEFDQSNTAGTAELVRPVGKINFAPGIQRRSMLLWSEHCIECAAPECYQSCDLYISRPDQRCRRFDFGTRRNKHFKGATGAAAEVVFSQWGKFEARGNTVLFRSRLLRFFESLVYALLPVANLIGKLVRRHGGSWQWDSLSFELFELAGRRLHDRSTFKKTPDGLLFEIYNPDSQPCQLKFECSVIRSKLPADGAGRFPHWEKLVCKPGYNRIFIRYTALSPVVESGIPYKLSLTPEAVSGTHLVFMTLAFVKLESRFLNAELEYVAATVTQDTRSSVRQIPIEVMHSPRRPAAKCVVFDLDNTLWDGVLLEGDVSLRPGVGELFRELDRRGILISVASKNAEQDGLDKLREFGLLDYIVFPRINWLQKSSNLRALARKISIGIDTFIFVDDNPFEREEVLNADSAIEVLSEAALDDLLNHPRLRGGRTAESANRRAMYQQQIQREEAQIEFGGDYLVFLKECQIVVTIGPSLNEQQGRVEELLQRTNQLNFSGSRYSRDAIEKMWADTSTDKHIIQCKDRYGDYGIVGFSITSADSELVTVHDFMLSCRVQGKLIEKAFFNYLASKYLNDTGSMRVNFVSTDRNALARQVLQETGFSLEAGQQPTLQVVPGNLAVDFLEIRSDLQSGGLSL